MAEASLVYLRKGEAPPPSGKSVIVDCSLAEKGTTVTDAPDQKVILVSYPELQDAIVSLSEQGFQNIYVRGMDDV
jgi:hypothetical protein